MSSYMHREMLLFFQSAGLGAVILLCYDVLRIVRNVIPHHPGAVAVEDFLYWLSVGMVVFVRIYQTNQGILRAFLIWGAVFGALFCHLTVSPYFVSVFTKILAFPIQIIKKVIKRLLFWIRRCRIYLCKTANRRIMPKSHKNSRTKRVSQFGKFKEKQQKKENRV